MSFALIDTDEASAPGNADKLIVFICVHRRPSAAKAFTQLMTFRKCACSSRFPEVVRQSITRTRPSRSSTTGQEPNIEEPRTIDGSSDCCAEPLINRFFRFSCNNRVLRQVFQ